MSSTQDTPPGWYPDPSGDGGRRWWDGNAWTDHREPAGGADAPTAAQPATPEAGAGAPIPPPPGGDATVQMPAAQSDQPAWGGTPVPPPPGAPGGGFGAPGGPGAPGAPGDPAGGGFGGPPPYVPGGPTGGSGDGKNNTPLIIGIAAVVLLILIGGGVFLATRGGDTEVGTGPDGSTTTTAEPAGSTTSTTEREGTSSTRRTTTTRATTTTAAVPKGPADAVPASGSGWKMDTSPAWVKTDAPGGVDTMWTIGPREQSLGDSVALQVLPQGGMSAKELTDIMANGLGSSTGGAATVTSSKVESKGGRDYGVIDLSMATSGTTISQRVYLFPGKSKSLMVMAQGLPSRVGTVIEQAEPYILTAQLT